MQIYSDKVFNNPSEIIEVFDPQRIKEGIKKIETLKNKGLHLIGYLRYDLSQSAGGYPILYFEGYDSYEPFLPAFPAYPIGTIITPLIEKNDYIKKVQFIKEQIKSGMTYEVNYTYPSVLKTNASTLDLYHYFLKKQKTPYNAFIKNKYETILSFSPEMFFSINGNKIWTKPMKGTIKRGKDQTEDERFKKFLYNDAKNRAENVMIVDLLRNDLGRISKVGSVHVDKLFEIEEHETLFQMTSEISAELKEEVSLYDVITSLYPCGSITGAPKVATMQIIRDIEPYSREVYCGAIGYLHKHKTVFSVPIRILQKKQDEMAYRYYAGGAIVWDSIPEEEWEETLTKTKFLETDFSLIETFIGGNQKEEQIHLKRLNRSAKALHFKWNKNIENFNFSKNIVSRIELFKDGRFKVTTRPIPKPLKHPKVKISGTVHSTNPFLYHKTSIRDPAPDDVFDRIRTNERGEITEGTFTNIAIKTGNQLYTPPVNSGLLNGIMRQKLINEGTITEKVLFKEDLEQADKVYCLNSVRGIFEVKLCSSSF